MEQSVSLMRKRHTHYTQLIKESNIKTAKEFFDKFREHFELYGIDLTLNDDETMCLIHLNLEDYDYESYRVLNGEGILAVVSPIVDYKYMFYNQDINIFEENTF